MRIPDSIASHAGLVLAVCLGGCYVDAGYEQHAGAVACEDGEGTGGMCATAPAVRADECTDVSVQDPDLVEPGLQLLIDQSNSMTASFGASDRWEAVRTTLLDGTNGLVPRYGAKADFSATLYTGIAGGDQCPLLSPDASVATGLAAIETLLQADPVQDTPTGESIDEAVARMPAATIDEQQRAILLVTDGSPDTCMFPDANDPDDPNYDLARDLSEDAAAAAYAAGIEVYVLVIEDGDDAQLESHIQRLANAGLGLDRATGGAPFFKATDPQALQAQLDTMLRTAFRCRFELGATVSDPTDGTVTLGGETLVYESDWQILDGASGSLLELVGQACNDYLDDAGPLDAEFLCPVQPPPPPDCTDWADCAACMDDPACPSECLAELDCPMCEDGAASNDPRCATTCPDGSAGPDCDVPVYAGGGCSATGNGRLADLLFLLSVLLGLSLWRRRRARRRVAMAALLALSIGAAPAAQAQQQDDFAADRLRLVVDRDGLFNVEGGAVSPRGSWDVAMWGAAARDVVVLYTGEDGERLGTPLRTQVAGNLTGALALSDSVQLGVDIPLILSQSSDDASPLTTMEYPGMGFGDIRLLVKWQLLGQADHDVDLAVTPMITVPTGDSDIYRGDAGPVFAPAVAASRDFDQLKLAGNVGYQTRSTMIMADPVLEVRDEVFARLGAGYRLEEVLSVPLGVGVTLAAATAASSPLESFHQNGLEALAGATYDIGGLAQITLAGGRGLSQGLGTPEWRVLGGVRLGREEVARQRRPLVEPATVAQTTAESCPDVSSDRDGDGLNDLIDECPDVAEDLDGFVDKDGCPEEDPEPVVVAASCPEPPAEAYPDRDDDTVVDCVDKCIDTPGVPEYDGCRPPREVSTQLEDLQKMRGVNFETDSAVIKKDDGSYEILDNAAKVLLENPQILKVEVAGHTDDVGRAPYNLDLSQRRAESVVAYLANKGVERERLVPRGYGESEPLIESTTAEARSKNRRVEFVILEPKMENE